MQKLIFGVYGLICYTLGLVSLIGFAFFANNTFVDIGLALNTPILGIFAIDIAAAMTPMPALLTNILLVILFALQHTVMARASFKAKLTKVVPAPLERSTYVLATALVIFVMLLFWRPMTDTIWSVEDPMLRTIISALFWGGWVITFLATQMIDGMHLMGIRQSMNADASDAQNKTFVTPLFYKLVRHPIQTGVIIAMLATPDMTEGRAILAVGIIIYIIVGLHYEEKDLIKEFGDTYRDYMKRVPGLFPRLFISKKQ
ncbi:methyltransferase family protein [Kordiimonas aquimaris]|uniref:methyltransferase family protein n=1 Tax=Kordiimonas aquimaris TaxID=707591 RepID=UPI0021D0B950|nr:isoprenylcysteine carboxylmethyltransferase family protein [Kordiimonas aquimaris]